VNGIDIFDPDRHPYSLVAALIAVRAKCHWGFTFATPALTAFAKEDLAVSAANATKRRRIPPIPCFGPSQLLEPIETLLYVGNIQNGCEPFCIQSVNPPFDFLLFAPR
jgi:hypothetical protein